MATHSSVLAWRIPGTGEPWWAVVYGVAQSWTWLKRLSSSSNSRQHIKRQRHHFAQKGPYSQSYGFSSSHVQMWELNHTEGFWNEMLEKTLESPLYFKEIKGVNPEGKQPWILTERTDDEAEAAICWPCGAKSWLIGKEDSDAGKDWSKRIRGWQRMR